MPLYGRRISKPNPGVGIDPSHPLSRGLVAFWAFNEASGPSAYDGSPSGRAAAIAATPSWRSGRYGPALSFNGTGTNDYASFADAGLPVGSAPVTVAARAQTAAAHDGFVMRYGSTSGTAGQVYLGQYDLGAGRHLIVGTGGSNSNLDGGVAINDGAWHHLAATWDGSAWHLYLDGRLVRSGSPAAGKSTVLTGTGYLSSDDAQDWSGLIDHVAIWSRALSAAEVSAIAGNPWQVFTAPAYRIFGGMKRFRRTLYDRAGSRGVA